MILVLRMSSCLHALACAFLCGYGSLTAPAGAAGLIRIHLGCLDILISLECFVLYAVFKGRSGDGEIRTLDPLLARQVLSQLSYTPIKFRRPPALPYRRQHSTIGRLRLNCRVRDGNECVPQTYRHRKLITLSLSSFGTADERMLAYVRPADRNYSRRSLHEGSEGSRTQAKGRLNLHNQRPDSTDIPYSFP